MKVRLLIILSLVLFFMTSCIKDEPVFKEADIEKDGFSLIEEGIISNVAYERNIITVIVHDMSKVSGKTITPIIKISPGATILPLSGTPVKVLNDNLKYTVTAESGDKKEYIIIFKTYADDDFMFFDFEDWIEKTALGKTYDNIADPFWSSANDGAYMATTIQTGNFPTRKTTDSYSGDYAVLMETQKGVKNSGGLVPTLMAGSAYRGEFIIDFPTENSAKFGQIFAEALGKPVKLSGYFKYTPGKEYFDDGTPVSGIIDQCDLYAVLFKVTKGEKGLSEYLTCHDVKNSNKIVASAFFDKAKLTVAEKGFTKFETYFTYSEDINYNQYDYKLAIVLTSSIDGAFFKGAVGSNLIVDAIKVDCKSLSPQQ